MSITFLCVRSAAGAVISAAQSVASRVRSLLHFSVPDEGPLADADTYMPDFMKLLATGIRKNSGGLLDQVRAVAQKVREGMTLLDGTELPGMNLPKLPRGSWNLPQPALAGYGNTTTNNNRTTNLGGVHITVNGYNVQDDDQLATMVAGKINEMMDEDNSVFK